MSSLIYLAITCFLFIGTNSVNAQEKDSLEWLLIYYMPYDNNLSEFHPEILDNLQKGIQTDKIKVVLQSDLADTLGMTRTIVSRDSIKNFKIDQENSASINALDDYLMWIHETFAFKKCAVIFLDHGGKLNEIGLDTYPTEGYMKITEIKKSLYTFNRIRLKDINLLFLQVCNKSSLEPLYELHDKANYTLASQLNLGAPNTYYTAALNTLSDSIHFDGLELAQLFAYNDSTSMYNSYTCIDNSKFNSFKNLFNKYIHEVDKRNDLYFLEAPITIEYDGERYWDLKSFLLNVNSVKSDEIIARRKLLSFISSELISFYETSPLLNDSNNYCGISISALSKAKLKEYRYFDFYKKFHLYRLDLE